MFPVFLMQISKRSDDFLAARNDHNTKVILPKKCVPSQNGPGPEQDMHPGDYVAVEVCTTYLFNLCIAPQ